jgi:hypothetical protein
MPSLFIIVPALAVGIFILLQQCKKYYISQQWRPLTTKDIEAPPSPTLSAKGAARSSRGTMPVIDKTRQEAEMVFLQQMFMKLHNLESNVEAIPEARDLLLNMLSGAVTCAMQAPESNGLLSVRMFSLEAFSSKLRALEGTIAAQWDAYNERRDRGGSRELLRTREEAAQWTQNQAPLRCVDGAWLGHINKVSTPFPMRAATKILWQVMSEELGDGDLDKNHVHLFNVLLREVGSELPDAQSADFIHPRHWNGEMALGTVAGSLRNWRAGVSQLLISLFSHDMLPEILGFNLHFEATTLDTLRAARELKELRINSLYFLLHVTIDNSHSGHLAMAREAVVKYLETVKERDGEEAMQAAWRRVQAGYALSEHAGNVDVLAQTSSPDWPGQQTLARQVGQMFKNKVDAADGVHSRCLAKVGGRTFESWLKSDVMVYEDQQRDFLLALSTARPWIRKGDPDGSKLIQELYWGGKMFGSFTQSEVDLIKAWILSLDSATDSKRLGGRDLARSDPYWSFTGRGRIDLPPLCEAQDVRRHSPVLPVQSPASRYEEYAQTPTMARIFPLCIDKETLPKILPMWFAQQALLEGFVAIPAKTTNQLYSAVLRTLRAQYGFDIEKDIVDGMDEVHRGAQHLGLVEVGLQLAQLCDTTSSEVRQARDELETLSQVLDRFPHTAFAEEMLSLAAWPDRNAGMLVGMSAAFVEEMQEAVLASGLLMQESVEVMSMQVERQRVALGVSKAELEDQEGYTKGFNLARAKIFEALK